jgi:hypothetical protein
LAAELRIHHFDVAAVPSSIGQSPESALATSAQHAQAVAAMALIRQGDGASVDVWLVDRATGKTTLRTIAVNSGADAASVLAVRAVDLLRASLREFPAGEPPPKDIASVDRRARTSVVEAFIARPEARFRLRADVLVLMQARSSLALGPALTVSHRFNARFELGISAAAPLVAAKVTTPQGSASLLQSLLWADLRFDVLRVPALAAGVNVALGGYHLHAQGKPEPPLRARSGNFVGALGALGIHFDIMITQALALGIAARAIATLPRAGIAVAEASTALGRPALLMSTGIRVEL